MRFIYRYKHSFVVLLIIIVAAALRLYNYQELPFTYDEFSTLKRLDFNNVSELLDKGVKVDGHPAGFHMFMYFFTQKFGISQPAIKLINIILGIIGVFFVYLLGRIWYNRSAGVFASAILATLQYNIATSQIARMYGFGIFFVLLAALCISIFMRKSNRINYPALIIFAISASFATYSHYFSFLSIVIITISAWLMEKGLKRKLVFYSGIAIVLLFIPHLEITIHQLGIGGIEGWLGDFHFSFFKKYFSYLFHHSWFVVSAIILVVLFSFKSKAGFSERRYRWVALLWFILPIVIGTSYSYFRANLLHERVLYFSFPFLILFLASFIKQLKVKHEFLIAFILIAVNVSTLIIFRKHYDLQYTDCFKLVGEKSVQWEKEIDGTCINAIASQEYIQGYYNKEYGTLKNKTIDLKSISLKEYSDILKNDSSDYMIFGLARRLDGAFLTLSKQYFPYIVKSEYASTGGLYLLSKVCPLENPESQYYFSSKPLTNDNYTHKGIDSIQTDSSSGKTWFHLSKEYGAGCKYALDTISYLRGNTIDISLTASTIDSAGGTTIVADIEKEGVRYYWGAKKFNDFINVGDTGKVALSIFLPDVNPPKGSTLSIYIWNKNRVRNIISDMVIRTNHGNPHMYGLTNKIPFDIKRYFK